jgi:hypothetical protein
LGVGGTWMSRKESRVSDTATVDTEQLLATVRAGVGEVRSAELDNQRNGR